MKKIVGGLVLLLVTGSLVVYQINLRSEVSDAREKLKALESKNKGLIKDMRDAHNTKGVCEIQKTALQNELSQLQLDLKEAKESARNELVDTKTKLNAQLQGAASEAKRLQEQLATCQTRNKDMLSENDKQVQALNKELKDTEEQAKACASSKADLEAQLSSVRSEVSTAQDKSNELNSQLDQCYRQVNDLTTKSRHCNEMVTSLKAQVLQCGKTSANASKTATTAPTSQAVRQTVATKGIDKRHVDDKDHQATVRMRGTDMTPKSDGSKKTGDSSDVPYRGNPGIVSEHKVEEDGDVYDDRYSDGNGKQDEEGEEDEGVSKTKQDDEMEKVFQDEHQRRMNLLGNQGQERKVTP